LTSMFGAHKPLYTLRICPHGKPTETYPVGEYTDIPDKQDILHIPRIGEIIQMPDDDTLYFVHEVIHNHKDGFAFAPEVFVIARWDKP
jgi:hypothetical protein